MQWTNLQLVQNDQKNTFVIALKTMKYLMINLIKYVQDLAH